MHPLERQTGRPDTGGMSNTILPPSSPEAEQSGLFRIEVPRLPTRTEMCPVELGILDLKAAADTRKRAKRVSPSKVIRIEFRRSKGAR